MNKVSNNIVKSNITEKFGLQTTMLTIREIFRILDSGISNKDNINCLYDYLSISSKEYQNFLDSESNTVPDVFIYSVIPKLLSLGFCPELFLEAGFDGRKENLVGMSNELGRLTADYLATFIKCRSNEKTPNAQYDDIPDDNVDIRNKYRKLLREELSLLTNPDGTFFMDDMYALYQAACNNPEVISTITDFISYNVSKRYDDSKSIKDIPQLVAEDFIDYCANNEIAHNELSERKASHSKHKKDYVLPNDADEIVAINLTVIQELYQLLVQQDNKDITSAMNNFYAFLNVTEHIYLGLPYNNPDELDKVLEALKPFGFSADFFRKKKPSYLPMSDALKKVITRYHDSDKYTIDDFRNHFRIELLYLNDTKNAPLFYSVYKLYVTIEN